jgi:NTE family protein
MKRKIQTVHSRVPAGRLVLGLAILALVLKPGIGQGATPEGDGPDEEQARPTIGLVLSGGGARGLAHIGVIQWFEEHRIPIDLIAGTSMGGLVGGIYATGADSGEMKELIDAIEWPAVPSADVPYPQKSFRRKEDARQAPAMIELGLRDGFKLSPGIDAGHQVGLLFDRIAFPYSGLDSFDQLPTPFACVAVDLESGDEVVFQGGRLAEALRSTMSYPVWFAPVRSGERVMIDGGVLNNLPTDVMLRMGADIVIAVDLGMRASEVEPIDNVIGVLNRTLSVMMRDNTDRNAELADILITPDVSGFGFADFDRAGELERIGYDAATELEEEIVRHALDPSSWQRYLAARADRRRVFDAAPEFLDVEGAFAVDAAAVEAALDHHLGESLDPDHLDFDLTNITGWGRYDVVGYDGRERAGRGGLGIDVHEKTHGPPFLRPILDLRGSEFSEALISFGGRFTFFDLAGTNSEWRTDATYGQTTQVFTELFVPVGHAGFFVAPRAVAGLTTQFLYDAGEAVAEYEIGRAGGGGDIGYLFGPRSQLRLGFDFEYQSAEVKVGEPFLGTVEGTAGSVGAQWLFDGTNSPIIPTRGVRVRTEAAWIFETPDFAVDLFPAVSGAEADADFYQAELDIVGAHRLGGRFALLGSVSGGTSFGATAAPLQQFLLGGPLRLGALGVGELRGSHYFMGRAGVLWALADENKLSFFGTFYLTAFYEVGDAFERTADPFHDVTFGLAGETLLGGVFVGGAVGEDRRAGFFFAIGRLF